MADIQHSSIQDPNIHEPKGVSSASSGEVYVADGAGTGAWEPVTADKVDSGTSTYGSLITSNGNGGSAYEQLVWQDLLGAVTARGSGAGWPSFNNFIGASVDAYSFTVGDAVHFFFHVPHDYALGTDIYLHAHWGHNGTGISGDMVWDYECTYSKEHNQAAFSTPVAGNISYSTVDIATTPQYQHRIDEVQLSSSAPSASQLDTSLLEPDGIILMHFEANTIPTISGGSPNEPFLFFVDIHYQANLQGTLNKVPNFYG